MLNNPKLDGRMLQVPRPYGRHIVKRVGVRLDEKTRAAAEEQAQQMGMSLSEWIRWAIRYVLRKREGK